MSIPSGTQDTVWDPSTCLIGQMSSCFALHDTLTDVQARLIYELGPNQFSINWLDLTELNDLKTKFVFHYDAKCSKDLNCIDLSFNKLSGKFSGEMFICNNFRESLNSIGSVQIFYPLLNYKYKKGCGFTGFDELVVGSRIWDIHSIQLGCCRTNRLLCELLCHNIVCCLLFQTQHFILSIKLLRLSQKQSNLKNCTL